jgi:hypothetical protein
MGWTFYNASGEALTSFGPVVLTDLDIDGGTDIGEAIVDADLFIMDNGAGGTNVKTAASRIKTYISNLATDFTVTSGNVVIATAGKGIDFSAQASPASGMTSELLDHYEEGTFTPFLTDDSTTEADSQGFDYRSGHYVRIGRICHFQLAFTINDLGGLTTSQYAKIAGLPFTASATSGNYASVYFGYGSSLALPTAGDSLTGYIDLNQAWIALRHWTATGGVLVVSIAQMSVNAQVMVGGSYEVA